MKYNIFINRIFGYLAMGLLAGTFAACTPDDADADLGPKPQASFTVTPITDMVNTYLLTSTTSDAFYHIWDKGDGSGAEKGSNVDTAYFSSKGTYTIKLTVLGKGGHAETEQTVTVANDDLSGCAARVSGCGDSKTWVLDPSAGSLWIGDPGGAQWWANSANDVTARGCMFNDEFTFHRDGTFTFDNKGDLWVEEEGGAAHPADIGLSIGCHQATALPAKYRAWGASDSHTYQVTGRTIKVMGTGAFLGMYKAGDKGTSAGPEESITYEILELTPNRMVIRKAYDWGQWRFVLRAK